MPCFILVPLEHRHATRSYMWLMSVDLTWKVILGHNIVVPVGSVDLRNGQLNVRLLCILSYAAYIASNQ